MPHLICYFWLTGTGAFFCSPSSKVVTRVGLSQGSQRGGGHCSEIHGPTESLLIMSPVLIPISGRVESSRDGFWLLCQDPLAESTEYREHRNELKLLVSLYVVVVGEDVIRFFWEKLRFEIYRRVLAFYVNSKVNHLFSKNVILPLSGWNWNMNKRQRFQMFGMPFVCVSERISAVAVISWLLAYADSRSFSPVHDLWHHIRILRPCALRIRPYNFALLHPIHKIIENIGEPMLQWYCISMFCWRLNSKFPSV